MDQKKIEEIMKSAEEWLEEFLKKPEEMVRHIVQAWPTYTIKRTQTIIDRDTAITDRVVITYGALVLATSWIIERKACPNVRIEIGVPNARELAAKKELCIEFARVVDFLKAVDRVFAEFEGARAR